MSPVECVGPSAGAVAHGRESFDASVLILFCHAIYFWRSQRKIFGKTLHHFQRVLCHGVSCGRFKTGWLRQPVYKRYSIHPRQRLMSFRWTWASMPQRKWPVKSFATFCKRRPRDCHSQTPIATSRHRPDCQLVAGKQPGPRSWFFQPIYVISDGWHRMHNLKNLRNVFCSGCHTPRE